VHGRPAARAPATWPTFDPLQLLIADDKVVVLGLVTTN
jgi:hypothetical protein